jgi:hypothetical protein
MEDRYRPIVRRAIADLTDDGRRLPTPAMIERVIVRTVQEARTAALADFAGDLYSDDEAAERLGVSARRVRQIATAGGLGAKLGRNTWVFRAADIDAMRARKTAPGPARKDR